MLVESRPEMLKIAIVGCGKIADSHAAQIGRIQGCKLAAVCDREELMAAQLAERFKVPRHFRDVTDLLKEVRPDVVHVTTPPQNHFELGKQCLEAGSHVYMEKPFTMNTREAEDLIAFADRTNLKITAGHDDQFRPAANRARQLVRNGFLGGTPVHMESYYCYELGEGYARALLGDKGHWVRNLPGQLLHNIISHGVARIAEYLTAEDPKVTAIGFVSRRLREMGEDEIVDELRVVINDDDRTTAYFTFSSQMRPSLHQFRIFGPKNGIILDQDNESVIKLPGKRHKSYLEHFLPPLNFAAQYTNNFIHNAGKFLRNDFHMKAGMKYLMEAFYNAIRKSGPLPISYREILLTSRIMDDIFDQVRRKPLVERA
jgi:predicted dehydrogenase